MFFQLAQGVRGMDHGRGSAQLLQIIFIIHRCLSVFRGADGAGFDVFFALGDDTISGFFDHLFQ